MPSRSKDQSPAAATRRSWFEPVLVLACVVLPAGLFVLDAFQSYHRALVEGQRQLESTASVFEQHANNVFETYKLTLSLLDEHTRGFTWNQLEASRSLHDYLAKLVRDYPQIGGLAMIDAAGYIRVSTFPVPNPPPNFADRAYFTELLEHDSGTLIAERVHSRVDQNDRLNIVRRRTTPDGRFDGVLVVNVDPYTAFLNFWQNEPQRTVTVLVREDGGVLARYPHPDQDVTTLRVRGPIVRQALAENHGFAVVVSPIDQQRRMMTFQKVHGFPVVLIHGATLQDILRPWRAGLLRNLVLYSAATISLVTLALTVIYHSRCQAGTLRDLADRTSTLMKEVTRRQQVESEMETVLFSIVERQEADRKRIARDLHDSLGQHVALLHLNVDAISRRPEDASHVRLKSVQQKATATDISQELSRIAWELRPVWLDDMGLEAAIRTFVDITSDRSGLRFTLDSSLGDRRLGDTVESALYRALQEAVTNIVKHADATRVNILLDQSDGNVRLMVEDNGKGFPASSLEWASSGPSPSGGLGLRGICERLAMVHGSLRIESEPGNGAALILDVPV